MVLHEWLAFYSAFLNIHRSGVLTALAWLVPHETAAVSAQVLCTPYNHAPCHFMHSHIRKVYACLAVTCHLHLAECWFFLYSFLWFELLVVIVMSFSTWGVSQCGCSHCYVISTWGTWMSWLFSTRGASKRGCCPCYVIFHLKCVSVWL